MNSSSEAAVEPGFAINAAKRNLAQATAMYFLKREGKVFGISHDYSVRRARMGATEAARRAGRKQAKIAANSRTSATEMNAEKSSA